MASPPLFTTNPEEATPVIVKTMDDLRDALDRMCKHNRVSLTALNDLANIGQGILTRLRRKDVKSRSTPDALPHPIQADIKFSTLLKVVDAAGWDLVLQPKAQPSRRSRVLDAVRMEGGDTDKTPVVSDLGS